MKTVTEFTSTKIIYSSFPELGFAFNPLPMIIECGVAAEVELSIKCDNSDPITLKRSTILNKNGKYQVVFDLAGVARSFFDSDEFPQIEEKDKVLFKTLEITPKYGDDTLSTKEIPVLWGALQIGETYAQAKRLTMFRNYPFSVPIYLPSGNHDIVYDNTLESINGGKYNLNIDSKIDWTKDKFHITILGKPDGNGEASVFDYTFDYTFRAEAVNDVHIDIDLVDCCNQDGFYLRWINPHGEWNYYLFHLKGESTQTSESSIVFDQYFYDTNFSENGYHPGRNRTTGKETNKNIQLYASLIDSDTFDFLMQLTQSPVVDLFMGYEDNEQKTEKWMGIKTQAGTFAKSKNHLQDFEFTMALPQLFTQNL